MAVVARAGRVTACALMALAAALLLLALEGGLWASGSFIHADRVSQIFYKVGLFQVCYSSPAFVPSGPRCFGISAGSCFVSQKILFGSQYADLSTSLESCSMLRFARSQLVLAALAAAAAVPVLLHLAIATWGLPVFKDRFGRAVYASAGLCMAFGLAGLASWIALVRDSRLINSLIAPFAPAGVPAPPLVGSDFVLAGGAVLVAAVACLVRLICGNVEDDPSAPRHVDSADGELAPPTIAELAPAVAAAPLPQPSQG